MSEKPVPLQIATLDHPLDVDAELPGSKSITNRALLTAALAPGRSRIERALRADDTLAMARCVQKLGARLDWTEANDTITIDGCGNDLVQTGTMDARQSGTTARFIAPVLAATAGPWRLDGDPQLRRRPFAPLFDALCRLGASVTYEVETGSLPAVVCGPIEGGEVVVSGALTSQFLSGLLLAGPMLSRGLSVTLEGGLVSRPYVEMTRQIMEAFGASVVEDDRHYLVAPGGYRPRVLSVEPDASGASYLFSAGAICGGRVCVKGLHADSLQGDVAFVEVLAEMGATVRDTAIGLEVTVEKQLRGVSVNCADFSDTVPSLAVVAALAKGRTRLYGIGFIRNKESDRIAAVVEALRALGIDAREDDDGMTIEGGSPHGGLVQTRGDHRLAMAFSVLGLRCEGVVIDDPECVAKTFPTFFEHLARLAG